MVRNGFTLQEILGEDYNPNGMTFEQMHYFAMAVSESKAHEHSDDGLKHEDAVKLRKAQRCLHDWLEETVREDG